MNEISKESNNHDLKGNMDFKKGVAFCINLLKDKRDSIVKSSVVLKNNGITNV